MRLLAYRHLLRARVPAVLVPAVLVLAGCGARGAVESLGGGPTRRVVPVAAPGALSLATRNTTRLGGETVAADAAAVARAAYPGLTPASRPTSVVLVSETEWPAALAASVLCSSPTTAPILFSERSSLPAVSVQTLAAMHPLGNAVLGGAQVVRIGSAAPPPGGYLSHVIPAADPVAMAAKIARLALSLDRAHPPSQAIVLDVRASPELAMPAAGLSAQSGAPILFVSGTGVPAPTAAVLASMHRPSIYLIDGDAIARPTVAALHHYGHVTAIPTGAAGAASTRSATGSGTTGGAASAGASAERAALAEAAVRGAIEVARFSDATFGWGIKEPGHGLAFANLTRPLDAPAAALLSATGDYAPLLLLPTASGIPSPLARYLSDLQPASPKSQPVNGLYNHGWLIGDERAIDAVTQAELDSLLEISPRAPASEEGAPAEAE